MLALASAAHPRPLCSSASHAQATMSNSSCAGAAVVSAWAGAHQPQNVIAQLVAEIAGVFANVESIGAKDILIGLEAARRFIDGALTCGVPLVGVGKTIPDEIVANESSWLRKSEEKSVPIAVRAAVKTRIAVTIAPISLLVAIKAPRHIATATLAQTKSPYPRAIWGCDHCQISDHNPSSDKGLPRLLCQSAVIIHPLIVVTMHGDKSNSLPHRAAVAQSRAVQPGMVRVIIPI